jgi:protein-disulfide isomerase
MTTLNDHLRESAAVQERQLSAIERPDLRRRARKQRTVAQVLAGALGALGVSALVAVGLGATFLLTANSSGPSNEIAVGAAPAVAPYQEGLVLTPGFLGTGAPSTGVVVDVYLDPMCPACGEFGRTVEPQLLAMEGVAVVFHPIAFLDQVSSDDSYSTRAASAIQEVANGSPDRLGAFLQQLWAHQPSEGSTLTDEQLTQLATDAGVPNDVSSLFAQHRYADAVAAGTETVSGEGIDRVPSVFIDGDAVTPDTGETWEVVLAEVEQALATT